MNYKCPNCSTELRISNEGDDCFLFCSAGKCDIFAMNEGVKIINGNIEEAYDILCEVNEKSHDKYREAINGYYAE